MKIKNLVSVHLVILWFKSFWARNCEMLMRKQRNPGRKGGCFCEKARFRLNGGPNDRINHGSLLSVMSAGQGTRHLLYLYFPRNRPHFARMPTVASLPFRVSPLS